MWRNIPVSIRSENEATGRPFGTCDADDLDVVVGTVARWGYAGSTTTSGQFADIGFEVVAHEGDD